MGVMEIAGNARAFLRDFPKFFEIEVGPLNVLTVRLPHPLISPPSVQVFSAVPGATVDDPMVSTATTAWTLDSRNGLLKLTDETLLNTRLLISAYYYTWFADEDLIMHANQAAEEVLYNTTGNASNISGVYTEVTAMGAVVRALWSLALELSLDIDVSTPEGMYIPARQRFSQVIQMMQYWEGEYSKRAQSLNIGLDQLEQFRLRRVAYLTNRYVPVYKEREIDDPRWPKRLTPPIPDGTMEGIGGTDDPDVIEVTEDLTPYDMWRAQSTRELAWNSLGTSGSGGWPA
jgi:hypothetical protein